MIRAICPTCSVEKGLSGMTGHLKTHTPVPALATCDVICPECKAMMKYQDLTSHRFQTHGKRSWQAKQKKRELAPLDEIHAAEQKIQQALRGLEVERDQLHARIVEIDNTVAKYRKFGVRE